jgi:hypothetical protein
MVALTLDLTQYQDEIKALIGDDLSYDEIARLLQLYYRQKCSARTLRRRCKEWGFQRRQPLPSKESIIEFIRLRFQFSFDNDQVISERLQASGYEVSTSQVAAIRIKNGWYRNTPNPVATKQRELETEELVGQHLAEGTVRQYGKEMLTTKLRSEGHHVKRLVNPKY